MGKAKPNIGWEKPVLKWDRSVVSNTPCNGGHVMLKPAVTVGLILTQTPGPSRV